MCVYQTFRMEARRAAEVFGKPELASLPVKRNGRLKFVLGRARFWKDGRVTVELSDAIFSAPEARALETIRHELAHCAVGHAAGHGPIWKAAAERMGCERGAVCTDGTAVRGYFAYQCLGCGGLVRVTRGTRLAGDARRGNVISRCCLQPVRANPALDTPDHVEWR